MNPDYRFSLYNNGIRNTIPSKEISLEDFLELIKTDTELFKRIRECKDKDEKNKLKAQLSYVTFGGIFSKRSNDSLIKSSGFACFDVDDVEDLEGVKEKIISNKYTHLLFVSPSGKGLKFLVKIPLVKDDKEYKQYWLSISKHYGIKDNDKSTKDISRACYLSFDSEPFYNPKSEVYSDKADLEATPTLDEFEESNKDTSRSGREFGEVCKLIKQGLSDEEINQKMYAFAKWNDSPNQYKTLTISNARKKVGEESQNIISEPSEEYLEILKDKDLFNKMMKTELNKKIVGEIESRKVIGLCAYGGRLVKNSQIASFNLMVNDDAGVGKDYITGASLEMIPKDVLVRKTRISQTVLTYWHNSKDEPNWTWDGKVLYLEDISETILNHEVFKVMCSAGSSASIVKDQRVIDLDINGKPVMIVTTATATPNPELTRRFVMLNLDSSTDQTKEIMKRHSEFREQGIVPKVEGKYKEAMSYLKRVKVKIPFAKLISEHFPHKNIIMRTHYPRFLDFISASAGFHQYQRKKEGDFILAEGEDYDLARECFLKLCSNQYMIPLTINQKRILAEFEKNPALEGTISELHASVMNFISDRALSYNLSLLGKYGILETTAKKNEWNKTLEAYRIAKGYKPNEKINIPKYEEICRIASPPSEASPSSSASLTSLTKQKDMREGGSEGSEGSEATFEGFGSEKAYRLNENSIPSITLNENLEEKDSR